MNYLIKILIYFKANLNLASNQIRIFHTTDKLMYCNYVFSESTFSNYMIQSFLHKGVNTFIYISHLRDRTFIFQ